MNVPNDKANSMDVEYDREKWLARLRAGTPESDFPTSPFRGSLNT
jgi:hypothetical protein